MDLNIDILVNKNNCLDKDYVPKCMYQVDDNEGNFHGYMDPFLKPMLRIELKKYIDKLLSDAQEQGFNLIVDSGYRSYDYQKILCDALVEEKGSDALTLIAQPGASEHQTGLAVDFAYYNNGVYCDEVKEDDEEVIWLMNNSYKYGFILRYPKDKESITGYSYEPWHYRFVGTSLASELYFNNLTLEEYYEKILSKKKV